MLIKMMLNDLNRSLIHETNEFLLDTCYTDENEVSSNSTCIKVIN